MNTSTVPTSGQPVQAAENTSAELYPDAPRYKFSIVGVTPLLMSHDDVDAADRLEAWRKSPKNRASKKGDDRSPVWTWKTRLYADPVRRVIGMPTECLMASLRNAGAKVPSKGRASQKAASQTCIYITTDYCRFVVGGREITCDEIDAISDDITFVDHLVRVRQLGFDLLVKRIPVGQSKHVRVRPMFPNWQIHGELLLVDKASLPEDALRVVWSVAGALIGLCDFRPGAPRCPGRYGQFRTEITKQ